MSLESKRPSRELTHQSTIYARSIREQLTSAFIENLESIGRNGKSVSDIGISSENLNVRTYESQFNKQEEFWSLLG